MIVGLNKRTISWLFFISILMEIVYFFGITNFREITVFDFTFLFVFNITLLMIYVYGLPNLDNEEKPRSPFIALGSSMYDSIYALQYDYKVIVDRFDRENILSNQ